MVCGFSVAVLATWLQDVTSCVFSCDFMCVFTPTVKTHQVSLSLASTVAPKAGHLAECLKSWSTVGHPWMATFGMLKDCRGKGFMSAFSPGGSRWHLLFFQGFHA